MGCIYSRVLLPQSGQASTPQGQSIGLVVSLGVPACLVCGVLFLYLFGASCSRLIGRTAVCCLLKRKSYHYRATLQDGGCKSTARTEALMGLSTDVGIVMSLLCACALCSLVKSNYVDLVKFGNIRFAYFGQKHGF